MDSIRLALLIAVVAMPGVHRAQAKELAVPAAYATIQSAVDDADPGDEIVIQSGTYDESIEITNRSGIALRGVGRPVVDAGGVGRPLTISGSSDISLHSIQLRGSDSSVVSIEDSTGVRLSRCAIRGGSPGAGIHASRSHGLEFVENKLKRILGSCIALNVDATDAPSDSTQIVGNRIRECWSEGFPRSAAITGRSTRSLIADNRIRLRSRPDSRGGDNDLGIYLLSGRRTAVRGNEISGTDGVGIKVEFSEKTKVDGNEIECADSRGIELEHSTRAMIRGNDITECEWGIIARDSSTHARIVDNFILGSEVIGLVVSSSDATLKRNRIDESGSAAIQLKERRIRVLDNETHDNGQNPNLRGSKYDVLDLRKEGHTVYRGNDFPRGIKFEFDEDE